MRKIPALITTALFHNEIHQSSGFTTITPLKRTHSTRQPIKSPIHHRFNPALHATPSIPPSIISPSNQWGNMAILSFAASLAQLLGKTTLVGKLLGAPVSAMALTFVLSSLSIFPMNSGWCTLLPSGGSPSSSFLQITSLTLATPLLLLGTSVRGKALRQCGSLLGSFIVASMGTLIGANLAIVITSSSSLPSLMHASLPNGDGIKIASALLAKNIGGGINYMAVCSCLGASHESIAAGLCVDNVTALAYFPLTSVLGSRWKDVDDDVDATEQNNIQQPLEAGIESEHTVKDITPIESLSHAFTIAAVLTALGQFLNSKLHLLRSSSESLNLSLPITTLLAVLFSTYYPANWFLSPTSTNNSRINNGIGRSNSIARAGEQLGTSLLYLFFATAGAPGWRLKDSIKQSFPSIASFLIIMYSVHLGTLWGFRRIVGLFNKKGGKNTTIWEKSAAPQRLLAASSAAIGGPATAAALAKSNDWESLMTPSLLVGNVGYAVATFIALIYYRCGYK